VSPRAGLKTEGRRMGESQSWSEDRVSPRAGLRTVDRGMGEFDRWCEDNG
jgi:hypothetical protein